MLIETLPIRVQITHNTGDFPSRQMFIAWNHTPRDLIWLSIYKLSREPSLLSDKALKIWKEGKAVELLDESLGNTSPVEEALRCIQVCLMCSLQEQPQDRPDIQSVVKMLEGDDSNMTWKRWTPIMVNQIDGRLHGNITDSIATFEYDNTMQR